MQRTVQFARHLPASGWEAAVVTGPLDCVGDASLVDHSLAERLPRALEAARVSRPEPSPPTARRRRRDRWLRTESAWSRWWRAGVVETAARLGRVDAVVATMSPFESAAPAAAVAAARGVPWVADLRDPWALDEMFVYPSRLHRWLELRRMRVALASAGAIVMNTPEAAAALGAAFPELAERTHAVPNGWDRDDFPPATATRSDGAFRIVHTGELHTALGRAHARDRGLRRLLGGAIGGVDILARSHVHLLEALERLRARDPALVAGVELHLAGKLSAADRDVPGADLVREHGYLSHDRSVDLLRSANLLFLPMQGLAPGVRARIVPGKTYEYLAAGRPIVAAVPPGDARDILRAAGNADICAPADVEGLAEVVARHLACFRAGEPRPGSPRDEVVARYERRTLAAELAGVLDTAVARHRIG